MLTVAMETGPGVNSVAMETGAGVNSVAMEMQVLTVLL